MKVFSENSPCKTKKYNYIRLSINTFLCNPARKPLGVNLSHLLPLWKPCRRILMHVFWQNLGFSENSFQCRCGILFDQKSLLQQALSRVHRQWRRPDARTHLGGSLRSCGQTGSRAHTWTLSLTTTWKLAPFLYRKPILSKLLRVRSFIQICPVWLQKLGLFKIHLRSNLQVSVQDHLS